ncbi:MAG: NAD(P)H-dependent oxidoreductase [Desulfatibacillaceae bacterium]
MKAVILNGAEPGDQIAGMLHGILVTELSAAGWEAVPFILSDMSIQPCMGCFKCWTRTPGMCVMDDPSRELARAYMDSELAVLLTPVVFGGYGWHLKKALDRMICVVSPFFIQVEGETHHRTRYDRYPSLLGLGVMREADADEANVFTTLVQRNALNLHAPAVAAGLVVPGQGKDAVTDNVRGLLSHLEA